MTVTFLFTDVPNDADRVTRQMSGFGGVPCGHGFSESRDHEYALLPPWDEIVGALAV